MTPSYADISALPIELWARQLRVACWQGALLIAIIAIICRALPRLPAGARCALWWLACLKLLIGLVWTTPVGVPLLPAPRQHVAPQLEPAPRHPSAGSDQGSSAARRAISAQEAEGSPSGAAAPRHGDEGTTAAHRSSISAARLTSVTILFAIWLAGALARLLAALLPLYRVRQLLARATVSNDPDTQQLMAEIARDTRLSQAPCLLLAAVETEPLAISHWQNIVLLSRADFERLDRDELRAVLAHEFAISDAPISGWA